MNLRLDFTPRPLLAEYGDDGASGPPDGGGEPVRDAAETDASTVDADGSDDDFGAGLDSIEKKYAAASEASPKEGVDAGSGSRQSDDYTKSQSDSDDTKSGLIDAIGRLGMETEGLETESVENLVGLLDAADAANYGGGEAGGEPDSGPGRRGEAGDEKGPVDEPPGSAGDFDLAGFKKHYADEPKIGEFAETMLGRLSEAEKRFAAAERKQAELEAANRRLEERRDAESERDWEPVKKTFSAELSRDDVVKNLFGGGEPTNDAQRRRLAEVARRADVLAGLDPRKYTPELIRLAVDSQADVAQARRSLKAKADVRSVRPDRGSGGLGRGGGSDFDRDFAERDRSFSQSAA